MKELAWIFAILLALIAGVWIGYMVGLENMRREAIANHAAHWHPQAEGRPSFGWGTELNCRLQ